MSTTLHLKCALEVIILPNKKVIALFHQFFLQFLLFAEIGQKGYNSRTLIPPVPRISQILTTFNLFSGRASMCL